MTKLVVLDTRLTIHADDEQQLKSKAKRLKWSVLSLGAAVFLALVGSIVSYAGGGGSNEQPRKIHPEPSTSSSPSQPPGRPAVPPRS